MDTADVKPATRRRQPNYPLAFKLSLAKQACTEDVSVAQPALKHGLNTNIVFKWRQLRASLLVDGPALLPVAVAPDPIAQPLQLRRNGLIEIHVGALQVRIEGCPDTGTRNTVLRSLRR